MSLSESLYTRSPVWLQNTAVTVRGWQLRRQRLNHHFWTKLSELQETQWWSVDRIREYQDARVRELLHHAYTHVPFYRDWFDRHQIKPGDIRGCDDLKSIPVLSKQEVRQRQDELVSRTTPSRGRIQLLTSGTTGSPLRIYTTRAAWAFQWAVWWRHRSRFGLQPTDRHLMFGARYAVPIQQKRPPYWRHDLANRRVFLSSYHLKPDTMDDVVSWLNTRHFDFFTGYPSAMYVLANHMNAHRKHLLCPPKYVVSGSDALLPHFRTAIERAFGAPVTDQYGMAEFAGNLAQCQHRRYHLDFECCWVDIEPIPGAEPGMGRLIFTGWGNPTMPFIRYDVGDYARLSAGPCPCGRQSLSFESIDGRVEDFVRTPDGRMAVGMNQVLEYAEGAKEIQIYQDRIDRIEVRIVPGPGFDEADEQALEREFRKRVGPELRIDYKQVDAIPRTSSGKFRAVISKLGDDSVAIRCAQETGTTP